MQKICWDDEYKYLNNWLIEKRQEYEIYENGHGCMRTKKKIKSTDECIDDLVEHFVVRERILELSLGHGKVVDTALNKEERNAMEYLFDYLIKLNKIEVVHDDTLKCIERAKKAATRDEKWENVIQHLRKAIKNMRTFDIRLFLKHYEEHEIACESLKNKNVVLFIGSTGAGKSTTIRFLTGVEMERDEHDIDRIRAKKDAKISQELSIRTSVTTHLTPVSFMAKEVLSDYDNDSFNLKNKVIFCDTPGFGYSHGIEIDMANSFGLVNAMQCAQRVRIIVVISREDIAHKMEGLKIVSDNLYQYLSNYESSSNVDGSESKNESDPEAESECAESDCSSAGPELEHDIDLQIHNFLDKLKDINIIFTKFRNVKQIQQLFNSRKMRKLEIQSKQHEIAFYSLNKRINTLVNSNNIIHIDPINDDYRQKLIDILVTNDAKWINVTQDNFQPYISREKLFAIAEQVIKDYAYINRIIDSNNKMIYGGYDRNRNYNFDYVGFVANKIIQLTELKKILASQYDIISNRLANAIAAVTQHQCSKLSARSYAELKKLSGASQ